MERGGRGVGRGRRQGWVVGAEVGAWVGGMVERVRKVGTSSLGRVPNSSYIGVVDSAEGHRFFGARMLKRLSGKREEMAGVLRDGEKCQRRDQMKKVVLGSCEGWWASRQFRSSQIAQGWKQDSVQSTFVVI
eukprot:260522-Hanusia_phi.AAC.5